MLSCSCSHQALWDQEVKPPSDLLLKLLRLDLPCSPSIPPPQSPHVPSPVEDFNEVMTFFGNVFLGHWCSELAQIYSKTKRSPTAATPGTNSRKENAAWKVSFVVKQVLYSAAILLFLLYGHLLPLLFIIVLPGMVSYHPDLKILKIKFDGKKIC